jgi:hypothetical protein
MAAFFLGNPLSRADFLDLKSRKQPNGYFENPKKPKKPNGFLRNPKNPIKKRIRIRIKI